MSESQIQEDATLVTRESQSVRDCSSTLDTGNEELKPRDRDVGLDTVKMANEVIKTGSVSVTDSNANCTVDSAVAPPAEAQRLLCKSQESTYQDDKIKTFIESHSVTPSLHGYRENNNNIVNGNKEFDDLSETKHSENGTRLLHIGESLQVDVSVRPQNNPGSSDVISPSQSTGSVGVMASQISHSASLMTSPQISPRNSIPSPAETGHNRRRDIGPGQKKRKRRGSAWSDEQTEFLMEIWARHTEHNKEGEDFNHNAPVYRIIAAAMAETGNPKTWEQCKTRIHTLKRAYKLTRDEMIASATNITYCRHFDKLEIIMGDHETTTPQMLAGMLEERRKQKPDQTPQKRKQTPSSKPAKRPNTQDSNLTPPVQHQQAPSAPQTPDSTMATPSSYWYPQSQPQVKFEQGQILQQSPQQQEIHANPSYQYSTGQRPATLPPPPPYPVLNTPTANRPPVHTTTEINNNDIVVKRERQDNNAPREHNISTMTSQTWTISQPPQKEELEKMRLDLEIRKIEMERSKLEMEERQKREERDHQYRMLQLLLFGLGQQNSAQFLTGQGAEQVVAQAQNSTNLSRALENGLVPGGPHSANEKGLSFNEI